MFPFATASHLGYLLLTHSHMGDRASEVLLKHPRRKLAGNEFSLNNAQCHKEANFNLCKTSQRGKYCEPWRSLRSIEAGRRELSTEPLPKIQFTPLCTCLFS